MATGLTLATAAPGTWAGHPQICTAKIVGIGPTELTREGGCAFECAMLLTNTLVVVAASVAGAPGARVTGSALCDFPPPAVASCTAFVGSPVPTPGACTDTADPAPGVPHCLWSYAGPIAPPSPWTVECKWG